MVELLGLKLINVISGVVGAVVAILVDHHITWRDALAIVLIGAAVSAYMIPALESYMHMAAEVSNFIGFITGFLARAVILNLKDRFAQRVADRIMDSI